MLVALSAVLVALVAFPGVSSAASTSYFVSFGSQEYVIQGNVDWFNWTVSIGGSVKAIENNCARADITVRADAIFKTEQRTACSGTKTFGFDVTIEIPGGPDRVFVDLYIGNSSSGPWDYVGGDICDRGATACRTAF